MSKPFQYSLLKHEISAVYNRVSQAYPEHRVTEYSSWGGGDEVPSWKTIGFHVQITSEARLVFEVLYYETKPIAVIRVFREGVPEILYAKKWAGDDGRFFNALAEAADIFCHSLPPVPYHSKEVGIDTILLLLSEKERVMCQSAFNPIPPPFSISSTTEA